MGPVWLADVGIEARAGGSEAVFSYRGSDKVVRGQAYVVPLGTRSVIGFVLETRLVESMDLGFPVEKLRPLGALVEGLSLPASSLELIEDVATTTLTPVPVALGLAVPPGVKDRLETVWEWTGREPVGKLNVVQEEVLEALRAAPLRQTKRGTEPMRRALAALRKAELATAHMSLQSADGHKARTESYALTQDGAAIESFLAKNSRKKPAQALTVMTLQGTESTSLSRQEIKALANVTDQVVKALIDAGILTKVDVESSSPAMAPRLNPHQAAAVDDVVASVRDHRPSSFLLYGVTGSGKTEVYLRCAEESLKQGRPVLYLVPEIALTAQVVAQLKSRFGKRVAVMHSNMSPSDRLDNWLKVRTGEASVVVGARSALFAPLPDIGLIVMDEEHESSYKQETAPRYHAKKVAEGMSRRFSCPLVLGSATPSVESFAEAAEGRLHMLRLPQRAAAAQLPAVRLIDLRELYKEKKAALLSPPLFEAMQSALARSEQVMLFLNRRAYAPFVQCRECGRRFLCPNCEITLSLHLRDHSLKCHHCDHTERVPETCPECSGTKVGAVGVGVEKVEETVRLLFPDHVVERLDRDVVRRKGALEDILTRFRTGDVDVLVGTQMIAKGLDFPNVTVVGVVSADVALNLPDFRASERAFQLLTQVAGRAGRGAKPGQVFIQTFSPDHVSLVTSSTHDYETFFRTVDEERKTAGYPPYVRLVSVVASSESRTGVVRASEAIARNLVRGYPRATVLGPVDCALAKIQNRYRRQVLVKFELGSDLSGIPAVLRGLADSSVSVTVDVDPYSLM